MLPELHVVPPFPTFVSPADAILPGICVCTFLSSAPMYCTQNCKSVLQDLYTWCAYLINEHTRETNGLVRLTNDP